MTRALAREIANRSSESFGHVVGCVEGKTAVAMTASTKARSTPGSNGWPGTPFVKHLRARTFAGAHRTGRSHCARTRTLCICAHPTRPGGLRPRGPPGAPVARLASYAASSNEYRVLVSTRITDLTGEVPTMRNSCELSGLQPLRVAACPRQQKTG